MILASCASIISILANVPAGQSVKLTGTCHAIRISRVYKPSLVIDAKDAIIYGLTITGGGISWRGGTIRASGGVDAAGRAGYGAYVSGSNVSFEGIRFIDSNRSVVSNGAVDFSVRRSLFYLGQDGVIANRGYGLDISHNTFRVSSSKPTTCYFGSEKAEGLSARACNAKQGVWHDGWHQDAIQVRNGIRKINIVGNKIIGVKQGIGEMKAANDEPLSDVIIENNDIAVSGFHSITIASGSRNISVKNNKVRQTTGRRTIIRVPESAVSCENDVQRPDDPGAELCK